ncbi:hypothetical protein A946_07295 [Methylacidiphilum kamchatkense Kam1]|uniref:Uncharacterized protein n=1 Tax=Methylacidiphilum kamchatkense Kam1 TaxID=1202785 RepID=A0ABR4ZX75_9BACT|nr:hypothetical protein A946_07295 [Methylacidiphilum kamchatkense Kam1]
MSNLVLLFVVDVFLPVSMLVICNVLMLKPIYSPLHCAKMDPVDRNKTVAHFIGRTGEKKLLRSLETIYFSNQRLTFSIHEVFLNIRIFRLKKEKMAPLLIESRVLSNGIVTKM